MLPAFSLPVQRAGPPDGGGEQPAHLIRAIGAEAGARPAPPGSPGSASLERRRARLRELRAAPCSSGVRLLDYPRRCARSRQLPPGARHDSRLARRLPVPGSAAPRSSMSGKAKSLRSRLNSYFADIAALHPRTAQMVRSAGSVEWTVVSTEVEALQLEYNWIKEFDPRFNVRYRDDKSYPELAVTLGRGVSAAAGDARGAQEGRALLRPVRACLGDPRDARPAAAGVPRPDLLRGSLPSVPADRPAVPARLHRQVLGAVRRPGHAPRSTARSSTTSAISWPARPIR